MVPFMVRKRKEGRWQEEKEGAMGRKKGAGKVNSRGLETTWGTTGTTQKGER